MSNEEAFCQRFFAFSKRVPKDVKRFCGICRQHGKMEETRGHICEFKDCECQKCNLVRSRRLVMSQQIRLRRAQDKRFQRTDRPEDADVIPLLTTQQQQQQLIEYSNNNNKSPSPNNNNNLIIEDETLQQQQQQLEINGKNMCYFCQKCKNHGVLVWKKQHKRQCPFTNCKCNFCELIETRLAKQKNEYNNNNKGRIKQKKEEINIKSNSEDEENILLEEEPPKKKSSIYLEENNAGTSIEQNNEENIKLQQKEPIEALNEQIWRIQNQKLLQENDNKSSRNSSFSSLDNFSTIMRDISITEQQQQQLFNNYPLLFNKLITSNNIINSQQTLQNNNLLTNEQQQLLLLLLQTNQLIENKGNLTFLDQILFNYLIPKNNNNNNDLLLLLPSINQNNNNNNENNNNNLQKNFLIQIISQLLLQEQQKNKIAETIIGTQQNQSFLRNFILNGNLINNINETTNFNFLTTQQQQQQGLIQNNNNNNNNEYLQNNEQQQQQQQQNLKSAFNILQSGFGIL